MSHKYKGLLNRSRKRLLAVEKTLSSKDLTESESLKLEARRDKLVAEIESLIRLFKD